MKDEQKVGLLAKITTRNEAGKHFMEIYPYDVLQELEREGLLTITRPIHNARLKYSEEYWSVEVTEEGRALVDAYPECWPED
jgi:hypothetical protein